MIKENKNSAAREFLPCGKRLLFRGAATALVTPFADGEIDFPALEGMIEAQLAAGISALVVCGTTGEAPTLSRGELLSCVRFAAKKTAGRVPVIAGTSSNCTSSAVSLAAAAADAGADGVMAAAPYYNKGTRAGILRHFYAIADASPVPLVLYNVPSRTGISLTPDMVIRLAEHDNIAAVKEASGDAAASVRILAGAHDKLALYCGCDEIMLPVLASGGSGVISVVSNILPGFVSALCRAEKEAPDEAKARQYRLAPIIDALFKTVNPVPVKSLCSMLGMCRDELRLPLTSLDGESRAELKRLLPDIIAMSASDMA